MAPGVTRASFPASGSTFGVHSMQPSPSNGRRPNIVFCVCEDWGRHASAYADDALNAHLDTPNIDRLAREGALFLNARTPAPGPNPCRSSLFSGRYFFQTGLGAIEQGTVWDDSLQTFPLELEKSGYALGHTYEGDCGKTKGYVGGKRTCFNAAGTRFSDFSLRVCKASCPEGREAITKELLQEVHDNFASFLDSAGPKPFCYIWGPCSCHRDYAPGSGAELWGIKPDMLQLPAFLPDCDAVRQDMSDYLGEVQAMDRGLGVLLTELAARGEVENTIVVVTGGHGMPMPRAKATLYEAGCQVALAVRWPGHVAAGHVVQGLVNTMDLAPWLAWCGGLGFRFPGLSRARSLVEILAGGDVDAEQDFVISGLERHVSIAREGCLPYPARSLRTRMFLYIFNFEPSRWPAGDPHGLVEDLECEVAVEEYENVAKSTMLVLPDCDASPSFAWMVYNRSADAVRPLFLAAFGKRPQEELYDLRCDPHCMNNLAADVTLMDVKIQMKSQLMAVLAENDDPRVTENPCRYERPPYSDIDTKYTTDKGRAFIDGLQKQRQKAWGRRCKL